MFGREYVAEDRPNDGLRALDHIGMRCHAHFADQRVHAHHRGSLCLVTHEGVDIQLRCLLDELRIEFLPPQLVL